PHPAPTERSTLSLHDALPIFRDGGVERALVEQCGELFLVEVLVHLTLAQRDLGERSHVRAGRDADAAQRRDHATASSLREVEARSEEHTSELQSPCNLVCRLL